MSSECTSGREHEQPSRADPEASRWVRVIDLHAAAEPYGSYGSGLYVDCSGSPAAVLVSLARRTIPPYRSVRLDLPQIQIRGAGVALKEDHAELPRGHLRGGYKVKRNLFTMTAAVAAAGIAIGCEKSSSRAATAPTPLSDSSAVAGKPSAADHEGHGSAGGAEIYSADLLALNAHVGYRRVSGTARFQLVNGQLVASDNAVGLQPGMIHPQHIHAAASCPPPSADVNNDGFIDVIEGVPFYGAILVPLDSDLTSQAGGEFPFVHNHGGSLQYRQSADLNAVLADLNAPDPDPSDAVVKLAGAPLNLSGRHVVLHGVSADTPLPSSVASLPGLPAYLTLPVACGEINRVN